MPNWCDTKVVFSAKKEYKDKITDLHDRLVEWFNMPLEEWEEKTGCSAKNYNKHMLIFVAKHFDFTPTCNRYRGEVYDISELTEMDDKFEFTVYQYDAWEAMIGFWFELVHRFYPRELRTADGSLGHDLGASYIQIDYTECECGMGIFNTSIPEEVNRIHIDIFYEWDDETYGRPFIEKYFPDWVKEHIEDNPSHKSDDEKMTNEVVSIQYDNIDEEELLDVLRIYNHSITDYASIPDGLKKAIGRYNFVTTYMCAYGTIAPSIYNYMHMFNEETIKPFDNDLLK